MRVFKENLTTFTHWFSWTLALVASVVYGIFLFTEDIPEFLGGENASLGWFIISSFLAISGTVISFWKRIIGSIAMLTGGTGIILYLYLINGKQDAGLIIAYLISYLLPGLLLLLIHKKYDEVS